MQKLMEAGLVRWIVAVTVLLFAGACVSGPDNRQSEDPGEETAAETTGQSEAGQQDPVEVTLVDYSIHMPSTLQAGSTTFEVTNDGTVPHSFEVEGQNQERVLDAPLEPGESATLTVDLRRGTYTVYCPVEQHAEERGMTMELTVQ